MFEVNAEKIRALMFERGLSVRSLAQSAKINYFTASKMTRNGAKATAKIIAALANVFGVDGNELIKE